MHTLITNDVDIFEVWNILKNKLRYGDDGDDGNNEVWIDLGALPERVERRAIPEIVERWLRNSVRDTGVPGTPAISTVQQRREMLRNQMGVTVYFMDGNDEWFAEYTMVPISREEDVGKKLKVIVPFKYWREVKVRSENGGNVGGCLLFCNAEHNVEYTDAMNVLNDIQKMAFADLQPDSMKRLVFCLKIKEGFQIPRDISDNVLYRRREPGDLSPFLESNAVLLDKLKMLTDSSEIYK